MSDVEPYGRRLNFDLPDSRIGVSVAGGVSRDAVIDELIRCSARIERGHARTIVSLDEGESLFDLARSYGGMWATIAWRATFGRRKTERRVEAITASLRRAKASGVEVVEV